MNDKYSCFQELARSEIEGKHYQISSLDLCVSSCVIVAPHGGTIEPGSAEIARAVAADIFSWYLFESKRIYDDNYVSLHITSHRFNEPVCMKLIERNDWVVTIHGCSDSEEIIYLGGLEKNLIAAVSSALSSLGIPNSRNCDRFPGIKPNNLCNRGVQRKGLQVEISVPLREPAKCDLIADGIRTGIINFINTT